MDCARYVGSLMLLGTAFVDASALARLQRERQLRPTAVNGCRKRLIVKKLVG